MHVTGKRHGHKEYAQHERVEHPERCLHATNNHGVKQITYRLRKEAAVSVQTCRDGLRKQTQREYHPERELGKAVNNGMFGSTAHSKDLGPEYLYHGHGKSKEHIQQQGIHQVCISLMLTE